MKRILLCLMMFFLIANISAFPTRQLGQNLSFSITSNNATYCNITTMETTTISTLDYRMTKSGQSFSAIILQGNITDYGDACFNVECSDTITMETGRECFTITPNGEDAGIGKAVFYIGLLFVLVVFLVGIVTIFMETDSLLAKVGMFGLGYLMLVAVSFVSWNMANDFLTSSPFLVAMLRILFYSLIAGAFPLLLGSFAWYFIMVFKIKEIQRLMGKGFSYEEAEKRTKGGYK